MVAGARTIDRRDAAVNAGLAGAVLVILGYASGIGLQHPAEVSASLPSQPTPSVAAPTPAPLPPAAVAPPAAVSAPMPVPVAVAPRPVVPTPSLTAPAPSVAPTPAPTASAPSPAPSPTTCPTELAGSLVGSLPLVDGVTTLVSGLLGPVVDAVSGVVPGVGCTSAATLRPISGGTP